MLSVPMGRYVLDFVCYQKKLIIEVDGGQHNDDEVKRKDEARTAFFEKQGYTIVRFWNNEVMHYLDEVILSIEQHLGVS